VKAMILAAGVGERMLPLTQSTPKPLLRVAGKPLIEYHVERLRDAGFSELVVNVSHHKEQIIEFLGDGSAWGITVDYSIEDVPLETAGGIVQALPLLGASPFLIVNGDIWADVPFAPLRRLALAPNDSAHLVFVSNPSQHPSGDFKLNAEGRVSALSDGETGVTYAGVGLYSPAMFEQLAPGKLPLRPLLDKAIENGTLSGHWFDGEWEDVGTPQRLEALDTRLRAR